MATTNLNAFQLLLDVEKGNVKYCSQRVVPNGQGAVKI